MLVYSKYDETQTNEILNRINCWLLDMDGTVSLGEDMLPGADRFFHALNGRQYIFVTNNSSHSAKHYENRMNRMGIRTGRENILTSTDALILYLKKEFGEELTVYAVGTPDFEEELLSAGIKIAREKDKPVDAVLLAFDTTLSYEKLDTACDYIRNGIPYYAANPDKVCPLANGKVLPDCGALIAYMQTCTGINPRRVIGKPDTAMIEMVLAGTPLDPAEVAMVGDRIYTDMAVAKNAGILCIAVLTGESTLEEILESKVDPDFIFDHIGDIGGYLQP